MTDQPPYGQPAPQWQPPAPGAPPQPQGPAGSPYAAPALPPAAAAYAGGAPNAPYPAGAPWGPLAGWGTRVGAMLIDSLVSLVGLVPYIVGLVLIILGSPDSSSYETPGGPSADETDLGMVVTGIVLVGVGLVLMLAIQLWNRVFKMGRTGQSIGKRAMGIMLLEERTGRPMGAGMCFVRELAHFLDGIAYIGYLWPLWDAKRQTFADMVMGTVVVRVPKA